jgi:hypothetical protein
VVLEKTGVLRGEDRPEEGGRNLPEANGAPVDRVALPLRAEPLLPRADERGRLRVAPAKENDLWKRDEDDEREEEEEEERKTS